jgi:hypothetical protein
MVKSLKMDLKYILSLKLIYMFSKGKYYKCCDFMDLEIYIPSG